MAKSTTSFNKENQPKDRPPRGPAKKTLMLNAIREQCEDGEEGFLKKVVEIGLGNPIKEIAPNPTLLSLVINRIEPPLKSTMPLTNFEFDTTLNVHEQALQVIRAVSEGLLAPDVGSMIVTSLATTIKIQEITDIDERLKVMESHIEKD